MPILIVAVFLLCWTAAPAPGAESPLTLKSAVEKALSGNGRIRSAAYRAEAARQAAAGVESRYYPRLVFEETFSISNSPPQAFMMKLDQGRFSQSDFQIPSLNNPPLTRNFSTLLTLQQPLYDPSLRPQHELAVRGAEHQRHALDATRQETVFQVFRLYLDLFRLKARVSASGKAVDEARESLRLAGVRSAAGVGLRSDELRARTHLSAMEQNLVTAHNDFSIARLQLAYALGFESDRGMTLDDILPEFPVVRSLDDLTTLALTNRSDLLGVLSERGRADAAVKLAGSDLLPTVGAVASYQLNGRDLPFGADNDAWSAGVRLSWQLFDGFRRYREQDRARAERSALAEQFDYALKEVKLQVQESVLRRDEAAKRLEMARHSQLDAEETVRLLTRRFENSLATMVELLDGQTAYNQARAALVDAEAGYLLANGRVYHMAGVLAKEILK